MGPIRICPQCGVIAPTGKTACAFCNYAFGNAAPIVPARLDGMKFICVGGCDFVCRGCGLRSSLGGLDVDGEVECRRCGMVQAFDVSQWKDILAFAHDVADLGNPGPNDFTAQAGPYKDLGSANTWAEKQLTGMVIDGDGMKTRTLRLVAAPGVPLCLKCKNPLEAQLDAGGNAQTRCGRCGDTAIYALPAQTAAIYPALHAAISDDHRTDRQVVHVRTSAGGGAVAIACPTCNAPLPASDSTLVTCPFCNTAARIPTRAWYRMVEAEKQQAWWLLFQGPSPSRGQLERARARGHDGEEDDAEAAALRELALAEAGGNDLPRHRLATEQAANQARLIQRWVWFGVITAVLAITIPIGISLYVTVQSLPPQSNEGGSTGKHAPSKNQDDDDPLYSKKKSAIAAPLDRSKFDTLTGCSCPLAGNGTAGKTGKNAAPLLQLAIHLDAEGEDKVASGPDAGDYITFDASWMLDIPGAEPLLLHGKSKDAPSNHLRLLKRGMQIAFACDGSNIVVATQRAISSWSSTARKIRWSSPLANDVAFTGSFASDGLETTCAALAVNKGVISIPLASGKVFKVRLDDGSEVR